MIPNCVKPQPCNPDTNTDDVLETSPEFTVCLGLGKSLRWDGRLLYFIQSQQTVKDGTYGSVSVIDNCIVGFDECEVPTYTPPYCNPNPEPCQNGGTAAEVSPETGNIIQDTPSGLYARVYFRGANVTGTGTVTDPIEISTTAGGSRASVEGSTSVNVEELLDNIYTVSLPLQQNAPNNFMGLQINQYGIVTGIEPNSDSAGVLDIVVDETISKSEADGVVTLSLPRTEASNKSFTLGSNTVTIGQGGVVTKIVQNPDAFTEGTYNLAAYAASINSAGVITDMEPITATKKGPIMDIYTIDVAGDVAANSANLLPITDVTFWGTPLTILRGSITDNVATLEIQMPDYVRELVQIDANVVVGPSGVLFSYSVGAQTLTVQIPVSETTINTSINLALRS